MDTEFALRAKEFASKDPFPMIGFGAAEWWVGNAFMTAQALRALLGLEIIDEGDKSTDMQELARRFWRRRAKKKGLELEKQ